MPQTLGASRRAVARRFGDAVDRPRPVRRRSRSSKEGHEEPPATGAQNDGAPLVAPALPPRTDSAIPDSLRFLIRFRPLFT